MKQCFKCGETKTLDSFYRHPQMADGYVNKCKECNKVDVRKNREANIEYYRLYDRKRGNRQPVGYNKEYIKRYPKKYKARTMVNNAIRSGKLFAEPCAECGTLETIHAHHDDYAKPLNVRWLCAAHHRQWHKKNGEGENAT